MVEYISGCLRIYLVMDSLIPSYHFKPRPVWFYAKRSDLEQQFDEACEKLDIEEAVRLIDDGVRNLEIKIFDYSQGDCFEFIAAIIEKAKEINYQWDPEVWNWCLSEAAISGAIATAELMIQQGATDLDHCLESACAFHKVTMIKYLKVKGASKFSNGLVEAFRFNVPAAKDILLQQHCNKRLNIHTQEDRQEVVTLLLSWGAKWEEALIVGCSLGYPVNDFIKYGQEHYGVEFLFNVGLGYACSNEYMGGVNDMIAFGANDWNNGLRFACRGHNNTTNKARRSGYGNIMNLMIRKGATQCTECNGEKHSFEE